MFQLTPFHRRETGLQKTHAGFPGFDTVWDNFFFDPSFPALFGGHGQIRVDIKETPSEYIMEADLPGVKKEEISLDLSNNVLTISVQKNEEVSEENEQFIRKERRIGSMSRSFSVENIIEEQVSGKFDNGVLTITLPKKNKNAEKKVNRIDIQ